MRNLRVLALWGIGSVSAVAAAACATELQEPGVSTAAGAGQGLTSDSGGETTDTSEASVSTTTGTSGNQSAANTVTVTTTATHGSSQTATSTTQDSFVLGGTVTSSTTVSNTSGSTTGSGPSSTVATATSGGSTSGGNTSGGNTNGGNTNGFGGMGNAAEAAAASTTGGGSCVGTDPATAPVPLEPTDGWVDCSTNAIGIQGEFFTYEDGNGSSITSNFAGDEICVEGTAGQIVGGDNATWGAGLGINLHQDEPEADVEPWNAGAMDIRGFRFNLSAMPPGTGLRLVYQNGGTDYCVEVTAAGPQTVLFADTAEECWSAGGGAPSGTMLEAVKWQVTTNATSEHDFAFCISDLAAVP